MIKSIYIAGPLFNIHETRFLEDIAKELESNGYQCFLPHRDQSGIDESELEKTEMSEATKDKIFNNDLDALKGSDITVALITGWDIDSGTAGEIGYTFASGKPIIAIDASERRYRNLFVTGMITTTVNDVNEIIPAIENIMA
jgi:nucleoside 2-deoxyribosyltransferase|tara:strand:+ start:230 stop:655 length:426 start_codon:yes stop_codon:yes gene_type:complete